ncbi:MAG: hypothetical protein PVG50_06045 [Thiohalophilus sp.]
MFFQRLQDAQVSKTSAAATAQRKNEVPMFSHVLLLSQELHCSGTVVIVIELIAADYG